MTMRFAVHQHDDGWYRLTVETAQKITLLLCECETPELAQFLQASLDCAPSMVQQQVIAKVGRALLSDLAKTA